MPRLARRERTAPQPSSPAGGPNQGHHDQHDTGAAPFRPCGPQQVAPGPSCSCCTAAGPTACSRPGPGTCPPSGSVPFARALHRELGPQGVAVWSVRYRYRGWNGSAASPVADARAALDGVRRTHGQVPVVLLGHSMGARTALRVADDPLVRGVTALAPWLPDGEPVDVDDVVVRLVHGAPTAGPTRRPPPGGRSAPAPSPPTCRSPSWREPATSCCADRAGGAPLPARA